MYGYSGRPVAVPEEVVRKMVMGFGPGMGTRGVMVTMAFPALSGTVSPWKARSKITAARDKM